MRRFLFYLFICLFAYLFIFSSAPPVRAGCSYYIYYGCVGSCACPAGYTGSCYCSGGWSCGPVYNCSPIVINPTNPPAPSATPYPTAIFGTPPPTPYIDKCGAFYCPSNSYCCGTYQCCPIGQVTPPGGSSSPPPTCAISASPASMNYGNSSTISWSSANATSCTIQHPGWTGTSGSQNTGILPADTIYTESCSGDGGSCTAQAAVTVIPPANQTSVISGVLRQKSGIGCYQAGASNNFNVANLSGTTGDNCVTASCAASPDNANAVAYSCTVTWDNQACVAQGRQPNTTQTLTINAAATGYDSGQFSDASCTLNGTSLSIVSGVNNSSADITFPFTGNNWIKLKDSSFNGVSITGITVPAFVTAYDADDDGTKYFIIGNAGAVLNATVIPGTAYSTLNNWHNSSYTESSPMSPAAFLSYVKARRQYATLVLRRA